MSRIRIGACILLLLLAVCIASAIYMPKTQGKIAQQLQQAARYAQNGDWADASAAAQQAKLAWEKARFFTAVTADHSPMDQIDALFSQLEVYAGQKETTSFAATALQLSHLSAALGEDHIFRWQNLL